MDTIGPRFPPRSLLLTFCLPQTPRTRFPRSFWACLRRRTLSGPGTQFLHDAILNSLKVSELVGARALVVDPAGGGCIGVLPPLRLFRFAGHGAHGPAAYIPAPHQQGNVCALNLASFNRERGGARCIFKGETCQKSGGFHQLARGLRGGRGDARNSDFADLAL